MKTTYELQYCIINKDENIKSGLKKLNEGAGAPLLVVDEIGFLLGTVSDGDIRRSLLQGIQIEENITKAMCAQPVTVGIDSTDEERHHLLRTKRLQTLPIIDKEGKLIGAEIIPKEKTYRPNEAVIMCGGLGTRLGLLTRDCPKPMLNVGGKPILERIMCGLIESGVSKFFFATNYLREKIEEYFGDGQKWGVTIHYLREKKRMGTGGALSLLPYIPAHPILVMNGDILTTFNAGHILDFHERSQSIATLGMVRHFYHNPYGVIRYKGTVLTEIEEKPVESYFINAGIYVIEPRLLQSIPQNIFIDMPTLLLKAKSSGESISVCPIHEDWIDIGRESDYEAAQQLV